MDAYAKADGDRRPITVEATMSEYQNVESLLHPFRMTLSVNGMISSEQKKQMSEAMEKMQERLEQLPPEQRKRMERMMRKSMGAMQALRQEALSSSGSRKSM